MTQYDDELSVSALLSAARRYGAESVDITDSEGNAEHFYFDANPDAVEDAVLELLDGGDTDYTFSFYTENDQHLGTFYVCLGNNDGSAVVDSSAQKWCDKVLNAIA